MSCGVLNTWQLKDVHDKKGKPEVNPMTGSKEPKIYVTNILNAVKF